MFTHLFVVVLLVVATLRVTVWLMLVIVKKLALDAGNQCCRYSRLAIAPPIKAYNLYIWITHHTALAACKISRAISSVRLVIFPSNLHS